MGMDRYVLRAQRGRCPRWSDRDNGQLRGSRRRGPSPNIHSGLHSRCAGGRLLDRHAAEQSWFSPRARRRSATRATSALGMGATFGWPSDLRCDLHIGRLEIKFSSHGRCTGRTGDRELEGFRGGSSKPATPLRSAPSLESRRAGSPALRAYCRITRAWLRTADGRRGGLVRVEWFLLLHDAASAKTVAWRLCRLAPAGKSETVCCLELARRVVGPARAIRHRR